MAAHAQDNPSDVPPIEVAMAISVGCDQLTIDVTQLEDNELGEDPNDLVARGVSRAFIMRSIGIDLCALGSTEVQQQTQIGRYLRPQRWGNP